MNNKENNGTYAEYMMNRDPDNVDVKEKIVPEVTDFSDIEYVQVDYKNKKILCIKKVSTKEDVFSGEALPIIEYTKEKYEKIIKDMKKIVKIEENRDKNKKIKSIKVTYKKDKEPKYFEPKCKRTLNIILKKQLENKQKEIKEKLGEAFVITIALTAAALYIASSLTLIRNSKYKEKPIYPKETDESFDEVETEDITEEIDVEEKDLLKQVNELQKDINVKHNRVSEKIVLINLIKGLNGDYNFVKYIENEEILLDEKESREMIGKVLNEISMINDNNINDTSKFVSLSSYIVNNEEKEMSLEVEKDIKELIDKKEDVNYANFKGDFLEKAVDLVSSNQYKSAETLTKCYSSMIIDQTIASEFNHTEYYDKEENGNTKAYFYLYYVNKEKNSVVLPISTDNNGNLVFYDLSGSKYNYNDLSNYEEKGQGKYLDENRQKAIYELENVIILSVAERNICENQKQR